MKSFGADRLRPKRADLLVLALLLAAAGGLFFALRPAPSDHPVATVTLDGVEIARQSLEHLDGPILFPVPGAEYPLVVEFDEGRVRIAETHCPGGDCAHTGWVSRIGGQIICLPNRLAVTVSGSVPAEVDAVSG